MAAPYDHLPHPPRPTPCSVATVGDAARQGEPGAPEFNPPLPRTAKGAGLRAFTAESLPPHL